MEERREELVQNILKEFMDLGKAILAYEKEYGEYEISETKVKETMLIERATGSVSMLGPASIQCMNEKPELFLAAMNREWRAIENAIEYNIDHGIEPNMDCLYIDEEGNVCLKEEACV